MEGIKESLLTYDQSKNKFISKTKKKFISK